jgi:hypothetical protein
MISAYCMGVPFLDGQGLTRMTNDPRAWGQPGPEMFGDSPRCHNHAVTLTYADRLDRTAVAHAAERVHRLIGRPEVAESWVAESSCTGMTVGALTRHLVEQTRYVVGLLAPDAPAAPPGTETISLLEHYARSDWVGADLDDEANRFVLVKSEEQAREGVEAAVALQDALVTELPDVLDAAPASTFVPWDGASLPTDDFLVTRLMEMVVHSDDLACSVDVSVPDFGPAVLEPVLGLLTALAVVRHGQDAVVRTLTRPQRAPATIAAF